jgi:monoamine oxidase
MDWATVSDESGVLARNNALAGFAPDPTYDWWGPVDFLVVEQHPRGFARLIDHMTQDSIPLGDERVKLNAKVTGVAWDGHGATVTTEDGRTFTSDHVISTMSLGVMRKHHHEIFSPGLPSKQAENLADNHQPMANLTHVLVQFPSVWWDDSIPAWLSANEGGKDERGKFVVWHNLNAEGFVPGSNTLLSFLGEPDASTYGDMTEAEITPVIMERLRAQNPNIDIPDPSAAWLKNWGSDPLFYGAYMYSEPGVSWSAKWKKPLKQHKKTIVQFAGEATCDQLDGYVHGALQSGKEAAANYLHEFKGGPNPEKSDELNLCNFYYY